MEHHDKPLHVTKAVHGSSDRLGATAAPANVREFSFTLFLLFQFIKERKVALWVKPKPFTKKECCFPSKPNALS